MKTLYLDCGMGAAGDMLTAALLELLPDPEGFVKELNALGIPGVEYVREDAVKVRHRRHAHVGENPRRRGVRGGAPPS